MLRLLVATAKALLWTAAAVSLLIVVLYLVNFSDEELKPETTAALKAPSSDLPDVDNGFFLVVGLTAPAGYDGHAHGRRRVAEIATATSMRQIETIDAKYTRDGLALKGLRGSYCGFSSTPCYEKARQNRAEVRALIAANRELMQRYEAIDRYRQIEDVISSRAELAMVAITPYSPVLAAQSLKLAQIAVLFEQGKVAEGLAELERDMARQRRLAEGLTSMIGKMIAATALTNEYLFLSDVLREKRAELRPHAAAVRALAAPLSEAQRAMDGAIRTEFRFVAASLNLIRHYGYAELTASNYGLLDAVFGTGDLDGDSPFSELDWLAMPLLKENATLNMGRPYYERLAGLARASGAQVADEYRLLQEQARTEAYGWRIAYNPIGKRLMAMGIDGDWPEYVRRISDLDGLTRLVGLQAEIALSGLDDEGIAGFLAAADRKFSDPYTGRPMQWDSAARQLWFEPRGAWAARNKFGGREGRVAVGL